MNLAYIRVNKATSSSITLALLLSAFLYSHFSMASEPDANDKTGAESGIYCMEKSADFDHAVFSEIHNANGSLIFAMHVQKDGFSYAAYGPAQKIETNHWRFTDADSLEKDDPNGKCVIDITFDQKNWVVAANHDAPCLHYRGARAPEAPAFPLASYIAPVPHNVVKGPKEADIGDNLQIMNNAGGSCSSYALPYTQPYTTTPPYTVSTPAPKP
jgi:hypothetical protein